MYFDCATVLKLLKEGGLISADVAVQEENGRQLRAWTSVGEK